MNLTRFLFVCVRAFVLVSLFDLHQIFSLFYYVKDLFPDGIYFLKVNNGNTKTMSKICSKLKATFLCLYC